jgi:hypothetical protein
MKDLDLMHCFLGLEVWQRPNEIFLSQGKYTVEILQRLRMMDCKSMATPMVTNLKLLSDSSSDLVDPTMYRQLIESLLYLVNTRLDICFAVNTLSQYMVDPRHVHWIAAKHVLRYLHGTVGYGLGYVSYGAIKLQGYRDSEWEESAVDEKSTSRCCFSLGSSMISWLSKKQTLVALSTAKAEYIAASVVNRETVWLQKLLAGLEFEPTLIYCNNQSCVKHIEIKYHYI